MVRRDELRRSVRTKNVDRPLSPNDEPPPMPYPMFIIIDDSTCLVIMVTENYSLSSVAVRRWNCFIGSPQTNLPITPCHAIGSRPPCAALLWGSAVANRSSCFSTPQPIRPIRLASIHRSLPTETQHPMSSPRIGSADHCACSRNILPSSSNNTKNTRTHHERRQ